MKDPVPYYPTSRSSWIAWIEEKLGITGEEGEMMSRTGTFPFEILEECFRREFTSEKGYSPSFIPALIRNVKGLVSWAFGESQEPLWTGSDNTD